MKKLIISAEVELTEKEAKKLLKTGTLGWDVERPIATVFDKDIKFKSARIVEI